MKLIPLKRVDNWRVHGYQYDEKLLTVAIVHKKYMSHIPAFASIAISSKYCNCMAISDTHYSCTQSVRGIDAVCDRGNRACTLHTQISCRVEISKFLEGNRQGIFDRKHNNFENNISETLYSEYCAAELSRYYSSFVSPRLFNFTLGFRSFCIQKHGIVYE